MELGSAKPAGNDLRRLATLSLAAIGVVYGDIGTSPLYTIKECFGGEHGLPVIPANVLGIASLVFWALIVVVTLKYILFVMRADNRGEGGILALLALAMHSAHTDKRGMGPVMILGLFGCALFFGDGTITPAISVLSAVEGLEVASPAFARYVEPVTLGIICVLFFVQSYGTTKIGAVFGPIMAVWFIALAALGIMEIAQAPAILAALNPIHGARFVAAHGWHAFLVLGSVVLAVTGAEALYADMGH
ncbi:MAG: KUP/HAK/KT family potassium transporter, partial [Bacteroidales bacterium]